LPKTKKKKPKRKYNPNKHRKPKPPAPVNPIQTTMRVINSMKPVLERVQARKREKEAETQNN
jgi:hypothetical protein